MNIEPFDPPYRWHVSSETRPGVVHLVDLLEKDAGECSCEDHTMRLNPRCKHIDAVRDHMLTLILNQKKKSDAALKKASSEMAGL